MRNIKQTLVTEIPSATPEGHFSAQAYCSMQNFSYKVERTDVFSIALTYGRGTLLAEGGGVAAALLYNAVACPHLVRSGMGTA